MERNALRSAAGCNSKALRRIFIVEDHPVFREGLVQTISSEPDLKIVGEAETAEDALRSIPKANPDLVLVDITLPGKSGLSLIKDLRAADSKIKLLVVSVHDEALYADRVLRAGGDGYVMKQEGPDEIVHAIRDVLNGAVYVSEAVLTRPVRSAPAKHSSRERPLAQLTDTELEILARLGEGKTEREIARSLRIKPATVRAHCARIRNCLKVKSDNALIRYAVCWVEKEKV